MKISIGSKIIKGAWGGGNNFAKNLVEYLLRKNCEVSFNLSEPDVDIILLTDPRSVSKSSNFNHFDIYNYCNLYKNNPPIVVHRINECDERKNTKNVNKEIIFANKYADHTVFVSTWLGSLFKKLNNFDKSSVILNGANKKIFQHKSLIYKKNEKFKLVTHHWSSNINKGFDMYHRIDQMLNDENLKKKIEFTIIGNIPKNKIFQNTVLTGPLHGQELIKKLCDNHAYITASVNEPGGNHQNEAINCGLPVLYKDSGCMKEYCDGFGICFDEINLEKKINQMILNQNNLKKKCLDYKLESENMCSQYYKLFEELLNDKKAIIQKRLFKKISILKKVENFLKKVIGQSN